MVKKDGTPNPEVAAGAGKRKFDGGEDVSTKSLPSGMALLGSKSASLRAYNANTAWPLRFRNQRMDRMVSNVDKPRADPLLLRRSHTRKVFQALVASFPALISNFASPATEADPMT